MRRPFTEWTHPRNVIGRVALVWERGHIARETLSFALVVCMLFTISTVGYSAIHLFNEVREQTAQGGEVLVTDTGITFLNLNRPAIWNSTQLVFTKELYGQMEPVQTWIELVVAVVVTFSFAKETWAARSYVRQELRAKRPVMATLWAALGIRKAWLWDAFLSGRALSTAAGYLLGIGLAIGVALPILHGIVDATFVNLFMAENPGWMAYGLTGLLALCVWDVHSVSLILVLRKHRMIEALRESMVR